MFIVKFLPLAVAFLQLVAAQETSLIIPGFDAQPFSADVVGVDTQSGRTTWAVHGGSTDATSAPGDELSGIFTVVEGADYLSLNYGTTSPDTIALECSLTDSTVGECSGSVFGTPVQAAHTTFSPIPVQIGTASVPQSVSLTSASPSPASTSSIVSSTTVASSETAVSSTSTSDSTAAESTSTSGALPANIGVTSFLGFNVYVIWSLVGNLL